LAGDELVADAARQQRVGGQVGLAGPEAVERDVGDVVQARDEAAAEQVEAGEDELNSYVDSCLCGMAGCRVAGRVRSPGGGDDPVRRAPEDGRGQ
jgi:hypothetical protein